MRRLAVVVVLLVVNARAAGAQVPAGGEFQVNQPNGASASYNSIAPLPAGGFVVVWTSRAQYSAHILGQRFDAAGGRMGAEFDAAGVFASSAPSVGSDAAGRFVVAWTRLTGFNPPLSEVLARRFDAAGAPRGDAFLVAAATGDQRRPTAAFLGGGRFVVVWYDYSGIDGDRGGVFARLYDADGRPAGGSFVVNSTTIGNQYSATVEADEQGRFVVAWRGPKDGAAAILAQRFDADGTRRGAEIEVYTANTNFLVFPRIAAGAGGDFYVLWNLGHEPDGLIPFVRRFGASGEPLASEWVVSSETGISAGAHLAADSAGDLVATWETNAGVHGRRMDRSGPPREDAFEVSGGGAIPSVASDSAGNFTVVWSQGGNIVARRYGGLLPAGLAVDGSGNGVLEPGETIDVRPSWRNVSGAAQAVSGGLSGLNGPPGASYTLTDAAGGYGSVPDGATGPCTDCYALTVSSPPTRPAAHWELTALESLAPDAQGQRKVWRLHVGESFGDVPRANGYYRFVETLLHRGITTGCGGGNYCPATWNTRDQMAVFMLTTVEGAGYAPPPCGTPRFTDVPAGSPYCSWIEELARRGVVGGCGGGQYCPIDPVTREQMAVFLLRTLDPALSPPACTTPRFADVPASSPFCRWIEELARRGITAGCGGGNYCPTQPVTREQMAAFLTTTFGLTLYGP